MTATPITKKPKEWGDLTWELYKQATGQDCHGNEKAPVPRMTKIWAKGEKEIDRT